jgi:hypothetical protein
MPDQRATQRWSGRLTSRSLPERDPALEALTDQQRAQLVAVWLSRAASERRVADAFEVIHGALASTRSEPSLLALAARAVDDEHRHAELCRVLASRYAGRELEPPGRLTLVTPEHRGAPARLVPTLHVLGHCAMNETFASAFLEASLSLAEVPLGRAALRELLSDEIDHARIGWAHLAGLGEHQREELAPWLDSLVYANLKMWRDTPRAAATGPALHRHGAPPPQVIEQALLGAVRDLIIPGLARFRLPTRSLELWLAAGAPTGGAHQPAYCRNTRRETGAGSYEAASASTLLLESACSTHEQPTHGSQCRSPNQRPAA